jgi:uncharacterized protein YjbI with pentapeptide repeats
LVNQFYQKITPVDKFTDTNIYGCDLRGVDLRGARLTNIRSADLSVDPILENQKILSDQFIGNDRDGFSLLHGIEPYTLVLDVNNDNYIRFNTNEYIVQSDYLELNNSIDNEKYLLKKDTGSGSEREQIIMPYWEDNMRIRFDLADFIVKNTEYIDFNNPPEVPIQFVSGEINKFTFDLSNNIKNQNTKHINFNTQEEVIFVYDEDNHFTFKRESYMTNTTRHIDFNRYVSKEITVNSGNTYNYAVDNESNKEVVLIFEASNTNTFTFDVSNQYIIHNTKHLPLGQYQTYESDPSGYLTSQNINQIPETITITVDDSEGLVTSDNAQNTKIFVNNKYVSINITEINDNILTVDYTETINYLQGVSIKQTTIGDPSYVIERNIIDTNASDTNLTMSMIYGSDNKISYNTSADYIFENTTVLPTSTESIDAVFIANELNFFTYDSNKVVTNTPTLPLSQYTVNVDGYAVDSAPVDSEPVTATFVHGVDNKFTFDIISQMNTDEVIAIIYETNTTNMAIGATYYYMTEKRATNGLVWKSQSVPSVGSYDLVIKTRTYEIMRIKLNVVEGTSASIHKVTDTTTDTTTDTNTTISSVLLPSYNGVDGITWDLQSITSGSYKLVINNFVDNGSNVTVEHNLDIKNGVYGHIYNVGTTEYPIISNSSNRLRKLLSKQLAQTFVWNKSYIPNPGSYDFVIETGGEIKVKLKLVVYGKTEAYIYKSGTSEYPDDASGAWYGMTSSRGKNGLSWGSSYIPSPGLYDFVIKQSNVINMSEILRIKLRVVDMPRIHLYNQGTSNYPSANNYQTIYGNLSGKHGNGITWNESDVPSIGTYDLVVEKLDTNYNRVIEKTIPLKVVRKAVAHLYDQGTTNYINGDTNAYYNLSESRVTSGILWDPAYIPSVGTYDFVVTAYDTSTGQDTEQYRIPLNVVHATKAALYNQSDIVNGVVSGTPVETPYGLSSLKSRDGFLWERSRIPSRGYYVMVISTEQSNGTIEHHMNINVKVVFSTLTIYNEDASYYYWYTLTPSRAATGFLWKYVAVIDYYDLDQGKWVVDIRMKCVIHDFTTPQTQIPSQYKLLNNSIIGQDVNLSNTYQRNIDITGFNLQSVDFKNTRSDNITRKILTKHIELDQLSTGTDGYALLNNEQYEIVFAANVDNTFTYDLAEYISGASAGHIFVQGTTRYPENNTGAYYYMDQERSTGLKWKSQYNVEPGVYDFVIYHDDFNRNIGSVKIKLTVYDFVNGYETKLPYQYDIVRGHITGPYVNLPNYTWSGLILNNEYYKNISLIGIKINENAELNYINFTNANFTTCVLEDAKIMNSTFSNVNFTSATIKNVTFESCLFESCLFDSATLETVDLSDSFLMDNTFSNITTKNLILPVGFKVENNIVFGPRQNYDSLDISNIDMSDINLSYCSFINTKMNGCDLSNCVLIATDFSYADLSHSTQFKTNLDNVTSDGIIFNDNTILPIGYTKDDFDTQLSAVPLENRLSITVNGGKRNSIVSGNYQYEQYDRLNIVEDNGEHIFAKFTEPNMSEAGHQEITYTIFNQAGFTNTITEHLIITPSVRSILTPDGKGGVYTKISPLTNKRDIYTHEIIDGIRIRKGNVISCPTDIHESEQFAANFAVSSEFDIIITYSHNKLFIYKFISNLNEWVIDQTINASYVNQFRHSTIMYDNNTKNFIINSINDDDVNYNYKCSYYVYDTVESRWYLDSVFKENGLVKVNFKNNRIFATVKEDSKQFIVKKLTEKIVKL